MINIIISGLYGIILGIALSIDAFMFSLVFGSTIKYRREAYLTSIIVGLFHFSLTILGYVLTYLFFTQITVIKYLENKLQFIAFIILCFIGIMMINKRDTEVQYDIKFFLHKCLFAFSVSIDSFFMGIALRTIDHIIIMIVAPLFSFISCVLTYMALRISKKTTNRLINTNLNIYAGILLIILAIISLFI